MALTTNSGTAAASHLENIDFAGKTGTAEVVNHSAGMKSLGTGAERANAWFVGIAPRRNPDIAVVVLVEHGGWGAEASAPVAARVIEAFVDKQRRLDNNLQPQETKAPSKVEVGAVWSEQPGGGRRREACHGGRRRMKVRRCVADISRCRRNEWGGFEGDGLELVRLKDRNIEALASEGKNVGWHERPSAAKAGSISKQLRTA